MYTVKTSPNKNRQLFDAMARAIEAVKNQQSGYRYNFYNIKDLVEVTEKEYNVLIEYKQDSKPHEYHIGFKDREHYLMFILTWS
jgi:hypothetical protein